MNPPVGDAWWQTALLRLVHGPVPGQSGNGDSKGESESDRADAVAEQELQLVLSMLDGKVPPSTARGSTAPGE
jgi:hypothetical protein